MKRNLQNSTSILLPFYMKALTHVLLVAAVLSAGSIFSQAQSKVSAEGYVCLPCGLNCDERVYDKPGLCPYCGMDRVKKSTVMFGSIEPDQLCDYVSKNPNVVLLDVRTRTEFEERSVPNYGTLKNAVNVPIQELDSRLAELDAYRNIEVIVYCSHGQRSSQASYLLSQNGFGNVRNMTGGLRVLKDDGCKK